MNSINYPTTIFEEVKKCERPLEWLKPAEEMYFLLSEKLVPIFSREPGNTFLVFLTGARTSISKTNLPPLFLSLEQLPSFVAACAVLLQLLIIFCDKMLLKFCFVSLLFVQFRLR